MQSGSRTRNFVGRFAVCFFFPTPAAIFATRVSGQVKVLSVQCVAPSITMLSLGDRKTASQPASRDLLPLWASLAGEVTVYTAVKTNILSPHMLVVLRLRKLRRTLMRLIPFPCIAVRPATDPTAFPYISPALLDIARGRCIASTSSSFPFCSSSASLLSCFGILLLSVRMERCGQVVASECDVE